MFPSFSEFYVARPNPPLSQALSYRSHFRHMTLPSLASPQVLTNCAFRSWQSQHPPLFMFFSDFPPLRPGVSVLLNGGAFSVFFFPFPLVRPAVSSFPALPQGFSYHLAHFVSLAGLSLLIFIPNSLAGACISLFLTVLFSAPGHAELPTRYEPDVCGLLFEHEEKSDYLPAPLPTHPKRDHLPPHGDFKGRLVVASSRLPFFVHLSMLMPTTNLFRAATLLLRCSVKPFPFPSVSKVQ